MAPIPNGWMECPRIAEDIINNKFICFKTPLAPNYNLNLPQNSPNSFSPDNVIKLVQEKFHASIGLWIDLTNTNKYYPPNLVEKNGIQYKKIACLGGGESMRWNDVEEFITTCKQFLKFSTNNSLIAVHCTHGLNRTGFLVCAFLARCDNYRIHHAIAEFKKCRPIGIFRQSLVDQLCAWYRRPGDNYRPMATPEPIWATKKSRQNNQAQSHSSELAPLPLAPQDNQEDDHQIVKSDSNGTLSKDNGHAFAAAHQDQESPIVKSESNGTQSKDNRHARSRSRRNSQTVETESRGSDKPLQQSESRELKRPLPHSESRSRNHKKKHSKISQQQFDDIPSPSSSKPSRRSSLRQQDQKPTSLKPHRQTKSPEKYYEEESNTNWTRF